MWIRTCQECGYKQGDKPPAVQMYPAYRDRKCKKCGSPGLDYGHPDESGSPPSDLEKADASVLARLAMVRDAIKRIEDNVDVDDSLTNHDYVKEQLHKAIIWLSEASIQVDISKSRQ